MKYLSLIFGLALFPWAHLTAQVTLEIKLDQQQFLPGERLPVAVRIINRSGQAITLGDDPSWLTFTVEAADNFVVYQNGEVPVTGEFTLESSQMGTKHVDLAPYFVLTRPGRYSITATLHLKQWDAQVVSEPVSFDIISGAKLWSADFGVPLPPGVTNTAPEMRKYILEQANYLTSQLRLYLRLTDESESRIFKVIAIGHMVTFGQPEPQLDRACNLHVLYQTGARSFSYTVVNPEGDILLQQSYEYTDTRPRLQVDAQGNISVTGGARLVTSNDVPPPQPAPSQ